jgi:RNA polymerase sigma factor (TIGR02999 family)
VSEQRPNHSNSASSCKSGNTSRQSDFTEILLHSQAGDQQAFDSLFTLVYKDFRALARRYLSREPCARTLEPTALVNEVYLKLVDQARADWKSRSQFFAIGAMAMRRVLVNRALAAKRLRRGGTQIRIDINDGMLATNREEDVIAVDLALKDLARMNERHAKVVELRFFGGLTIPEIAETVGVSVSTIEKDLRFCSAWLRNALER